MECVPFETTAIDSYPSRAAWDATAAELVATMLERWHLAVAEPFVGGEAAAVVAVTTRDGQDAVLKVGYPHVEGIGEAVGLEAWAALAPRVLRQDPWTWSLLLERLRPGLPLSRASLPALEAVSIGARLHARLSACDVPAGIPTLRQIMQPIADAASVENLPSTDAALVHRGLETLHDLLAVEYDDAFLHGDFNPGNLLSDGDQWRVIDGKPMRGDPAFDLAPLVSQLGSPRELQERVLLAAELAGCDPLRTAGWGYARAALNVSWALQDGSRDALAVAMADTARWAAISAP